jgi:hypothetical protein
LNAAYLTDVECVEIVTVVGGQDVRIKDPH